MREETERELECLLENIAHYIAAKAKKVARAAVSLEEGFLVRSRKEAAELLKVIDEAIPRVEELERAQRETRVIELEAELAALKEEG